MPKISVIVPVYNVEKYLRECVDSILAQTFTDFELILINDGSQDNSGAVCDEYAIKDERITVIHQKNQGQAAARNNAIAIAQGEWIHFVDSDDLIHPQMLEILYGAVDENTKISMCGLCKGTDSPAGFYSPKSDYSFRKCPVTEKELISMYNDFYQYWVVWAKLIKKDIIEKYLFEPGRIYEDTAVVFKWINETAFINITDEKLYFYRVNPTSTMQVNFSLKNLDRLWAHKEQMNFFDTTDLNEMKKTIYKKYALVCADAYYRLLAKREWANEAKKIKTHLKEFMKNKGKLIELNEDWTFNMVYGVLYPKPIRIIFRLKRFIKKRMGK